MRKISATANLTICRCHFSICKDGRIQYSTNRHDQRHRDSMQCGLLEQRVSASWLEVKVPLPATPAVLKDGCSGQTSNLQDLADFPAATESSLKAASIGCGQHCCPLVAPKSGKREKERERERQRQKTEDRETEDRKTDTPKERHNARKKHTEKHTKKERRTAER